MKTQKELSVIKNSLTTECFELNTDLGNTQLSNPFLRELQIETIKNFNSAKRHGDSKRMEKYKQDHFQIYCIDKGMLNVKVKQEYGGWKLERNGLNGKDLSRVDGFELNDIENMLIKYPKALDKYEKNIPDNVYSKIDQIDKKFEGHEINYYVADLHSPDPILIVQIDKKKEYTFAVGIWI